MRKKFVYISFLKRLYHLPFAQKNYDFPFSRGYIPVQQLNSTGQQFRSYSIKR